MASVNPEPGQNPADKARPARPGWRGQGKAAAAPAVRHGWQQNQANRRKQEVDRKNLRHRLKILGSTLLLLLLLGAFVAVVLLRHQASHMVAIAVTRYDAPLPPNAWAEEDVRRFHRLSQSVPGAERAGSGNIKLFSISQAPDDWLADVAQQVKAASPNKFRQMKVILLYLSAHGVTNAKGQACLFVPGAIPQSREAKSDVAEYLDASRWLPVKQVIEAIDEAAPGVKKVLFLDANRMDANWRMGLLYNDFAERLPEALTSAKAKDVVILNSAGPRQIGWTSSKFGGSVFGYYLFRGLHGFESSDGDNVVTLYELRDYVAGKVQRWVNENRRDIQVPLLLPEAAKDFDLVWAETEALADSSGDEPKASADSTKKTESAAAAESIEGSRWWDRQAEYWRLHEKLRPQDAAKTGTGQPFSYVEWAEFERLLLRHEQLATAGAAYTSDAATTLARVAALARRLEAKGDATPAAALSVAEACPWRGERSGQPRWKAVLNKKATLSSRLTTPPPDPAKASPLEAPAYPYPVRADAAWSWLVEQVDGSEPRTRVQRALDLVGRPDRTGGATPVDFVEIQFLRLLAAPDDLPAAVWDRAQSHLWPALKCRDLAERAAAHSDPRVHYSLRPLVERGDQLRRQAEDALFIATASDLDAAERDTRAALQEGYDNAQKQSDVVAEAIEIHDRAFAELPYLAEWLARRPVLAGVGGAAAPASTRDVDDAMVALLEAVGAAHALGDDLDRLSQDSLVRGVREQSRVMALRSAARRLRTQLDDLTGAYRDAVRGVIDGARGREDLHELISLLTVPLVTGDSRSDLWRAYDEMILSKELAPNTVAKDSSVSAGAPREESAESATAKTESDGASGAWRRIVEIWKTHPAVAILRAGKEPADDVASDDVSTDGEGEADRPAATGQAAALEALSDAGEDVRKALTSVLLEGIADPAAAAEGETPVAAMLRRRAPLWLRDVRIRAAAPLVSDGYDELARHARELRDFDQQQYFVWQAERRMEDFWGPRGLADGDEPYFAQAAGNYLLAASRLAERLKADDRLLAEAQQRLAALRQVSTAAIVPDARQGRASESESQTFKKKLYIPVATGIPMGRASLFPLDGAGQPARIRLEGRGDYFNRMELTAPGPSPSEEEGVMVEFSGGAGKQNPDDATPWTLAALYRGRRNDVSVTLPAKANAPRQLVYAPAPPTGTEIWVRGEEREPGSVLFILDCSDSMSEPNRSNGRMRMAKEALIGTLRDLAETGQFKAGLWLYGHRAGTKKGELDWNPAWPRAAGVTPDNDVGSVVDLQPLNGQSLLEFLNVLSDAKKVQPWGHTPLYHAITEAVRTGFDGQPAQLPRLLVVLTDGENNGLGTKESVVAAFSSTRRGQRDQPIRLCVVNCATVPANEMKALTRNKAINGTYDDAFNPRNLKEALEKATGLYKYEIRDESVVGGQSLTAKLLGTSFTLPTSVRLPGRFKVNLVGAEDVNARFKLDGGENLRLMVKKDEGSLKRIIFERFSWEGESRDRTERNPNGRPEPKDPDFNPTFFYVEAGRPRPGDEASVVFPLSIQNGAVERFSPRPAEAWVEIKPVFAQPPTVAAEEAPYHFYDLTYESKLRLPAPVLVCQAPAWPAGAREARIQMWWKMEPTPALREARVFDVRDVGGAADEDPRPAPPLSVPAPGGAVDFAVRVRRTEGSRQLLVDVIERHPEGQSELLPVKVGMFPPPEQTRRRYFPPAEGRIEHTFVYLNRTEEDVLNCTVRITPRADLEREAAELERPLTVRVDQ